MTKQDANWLLSSLLLKTCGAWRVNVYGAVLKEKNGWKVEDGREAITVYLINKHGWTIEHCRLLSDETLKVVLADELKSFKSPHETGHTCDQLFDLVKKLMDDDKKAR